MPLPPQFICLLKMKTHYDWLLSTQSTQIYRSFVSIFPYFCWAKSFDVCLSRTTPWHSNFVSIIYLDNIVIFHCIGSPVCISPHYNGLTPDFTPPVCIYAYQTADSLSLPGHPPEWNHHWKPSYFEVDYGYGDEWFWIHLRDTSYYLWFEKRRNTTYAKSESNIRNTTSSEWHLM